MTLITAISKEQYQHQDQDSDAITNSDSEAENQRLALHRCRNISSAEQLLICQIMRAKAQDHDRRNADSLTCTLTSLWQKLADLWRNRKRCECESKFKNKCRSYCPCICAPKSENDRAEKGPGMGGSYGYGFRWRCCTIRCANSSKRRNPLIVTECEGCGHKICEDCTKEIECGGTAKDGK